MLTTKEVNEMRAEIKKLDGYYEQCFIGNIDDK